MTLIKIDLKSIKENPDAGNTVSHANGMVEAYIIFKCQNKEVDRIKGELKDNVYISVEDYIFDFGIVELQGFVNHNYLDKIIPKLLELGVKNENIKYSVTNNVIPIYHAPEPKYFYKYLKTKVECDHCSAKFKHSELKDEEWYDGDDVIYATNTCPKCGGSHCCDLEFEKIEDALRRKKC